jgi:hypothetical protein
VEPSYIGELIFNKRDTTLLKDANPEGSMDLIAIPRRD